MLLLTFIIISSLFELTVQNIVPNLKHPPLIRLQKSHGKNSKSIKDLHGHFRTETNKFINTESFPHFLAGMVAGAMECLVGHPLETLRIMTMTDTGSKSFLKLMFESISKKGGLIELYRGSVSEMISSALTSSYVYGANDLLKRIIGRSIEDDDMDKVDAKLLISAGATGCLDVLMTKPLEMIKLRQQAAMDDILVHASFWNRAKELFHENGLFGMYRGWLPTLLREALGSLAFFGAYQHTKNTMIKYYQNQKVRLFGADFIPTNTTEVETLQVLNYKNTGYHTNLNQLNCWQSNLIVLVAGGMAGFTYILLSHPLDVLSIAMQIDMPILSYQSYAPHIWSKMASFVQSKVSLLLTSSTTTNTMLKSSFYMVPSYQFLNMNDCIKYIIQTEGICGIFKGLGSALLRGVPTYAASFWGYEVTLAAFAKYKPIWDKHNVNVDILPIHSISSEINTDNNITTSFVTVAINQI